MDEDTKSLLGKDLVWNGMIADAKHAKLLDRVGFSLPKEEAILHIGLAHDNAKIALVIPLMFLLGLGIAFISITPIHWIPGIILLAIASSLIILWRSLSVKLLKFMSFSILVFTDKALYRVISRTAAIFPPMNRIDYRDIKAVKFQRNPLWCKQCKLTASFITTYNTIIYLNNIFTFAASPAIFKLIVQSIMHASGVSSVQKCQYTTRTGIDSSMEMENSHLISKNKVTCLRKKIKDIRIRVPLSIIISIGLIFYEIIGYKVSIIPLVGFFGIIVLTIIIAVDLDRYHQLVDFHLKSDTSIMVGADGVAYTTDKGSAFIPFSEMFVATPVYDETGIGYVQVFSLDSKHDAITKFGPIEDFWGLFFDIQEKYESWLEKRQYFLDMESIIEASIKRNEFMAKLERQLRREGATIEPQEVLIAKKPELDMLEHLKNASLPVQKNFSEIAPDLLLPEIRYLDSVKDDEVYYFVLHLTRPIIKKLEIVVTGEQLLIVDPIYKIVKRMPYTRIRNAEVKIVGSISNFITVTFHLMPIERPAVPAARSIPLSPEYFPLKLVLRKVPRDVPFIAVLANIGKIQFMLK